ncbi:MAG: class D beta-lactamase [Chitinophagaceae bacterium]|nr:class D beta-lactamase [Chitinophagaceae bacterium]
MKNIFYYLAILFFFLTGPGCSINKAKIANDLKKYFDSSHVDGSFSMFNNATGAVTVYNMKLDTQRFLPASTFKIVNSLIGIETGRITNTKMIIKWDGVKRSNNDWNQDLTMEQAFKVSSVPYYQEVARRIGKDTMQRWIDTLHYGNMNISGPIDSFWLNNTLKISPDEQLGLVKKLYFDQLPFQKRTQQFVRDVMLQENNTLYKLSYKTGWGYDELQNAIGWVVGWIEENRHVYFFVTFIRTPDHNIDISAARLKITKGLLAGLGFLKGEM